ncbi:MAG: alpha/beta fold hydrolase [Bosea sp. (in: a-proteobacteria)]
MPDVLADHSPPPAWREWTDILRQLITPADAYVLIGHSSASALVANLSTKLPTQGVIIVDGDIPPIKGAARPVRPALREHIRTLADAGGTLPIWSKWFTQDPQRASDVGIDLLARDEAAFSRFESGVPKMHIDWFDDAIELDDWSHVPAGFIQTSKIYDHATVEATRRGWPVSNLHGTHLDPMLRPGETAAAILELSRRLGAIP